MQAAGLVVQQVHLDNRTVYAIQINANQNIKSSTIALVGYSSTASSCSVVFRLVGATLNSATQQLNVHQQQWLSKQCSVQDYSWIEGNRLQQVQRV